MKYWENLEGEMGIHTRGTRRCGLEWKKGNKKRVTEKKMVQQTKKGYVWIKTLCHGLLLIRGYHRPLRSLPLRQALFCALITALSGRNANYSKDLYKLLQCLCCGMIILDSRMQWMHFLGEQLNGLKGDFNFSDCYKNNHMLCRSDCFYQAPFSSFKATFMCLLNTH